MAGSDRSRRGLDGVRDGGFAVVLVAPQLGENIGAAARAMLNCGLTDLRLVTPRDGWPSPQAAAAASGASAVLDGARLYPTVAAAVADLQHLYATTARPRDMAKPVVTPERAAAEIGARHAAGETCGVLFGRERIGLTNDEVTLADTVLEVPLNPGFSSLNLAQAVLVVAYAWYRAGGEARPRAAREAGPRAATHSELIGFFDHLEQALDQTGFFKTPELRPTLVRKLRNLFHRAALSDQEVRTLHGVVTALTGRRKDQLGEH